MKKILCLLVSLIMCISLVACGTKAVTQTDNLALDHIIVDDSYRDSEESSRRAMYVFFTLNPNKNVEFDCKMDVTIDETNTYTSELLPSSLCVYAPNYLYSGYLEDAFVGETTKFVLTYLIPEGDLVSGKNLKFSDSSLEEISELTIPTDNIIHVNGDDEVGKIADPEGYEEIKAKYEEATPELTEKVQNLINGKYWEAYVNPTWYRVEFTSPNNFEVITSFGKNGGKYSVRNGYIFCTYSSNGNTIEIPYEIKEQGVTMDLGETFRIK